MVRSTKGRPDAQQAPGGNFDVACLDQPPVEREALVPAMTQNVSGDGVMLEAGQ